MTPRHVPVLPAEVLRLLDPKPGQTVVDCTLGGGGHARLIAERVAPQGRVIGLDQDAAMIDLAKAGFGNLPITAVPASFDEIVGVLRDLGVPAVDGLLADLGISSDQLDEAERGFSFLRDGPLDMRMDVSRGDSAADLVRRLTERELADLIYEFGEERLSRRIAKRIVDVRQSTPIETTSALADVVRRCVPRHQAGGIDPATRTFQAFRIAVNDELGALDRLLKALPAVLKPGGVAAIISFHSLEDRRVKQAFRDAAVWDGLTRKPATAGDAEARGNPRARSAKLRAARLR